MLFRSSRWAFDTIDMLALACKLAREHGYVKSDMPGSNRGMMFAQADGWRPTEVERKEAEEMAKVIRESDDDDLRPMTVLPNIKALIMAEYCKRGHFGYLAYAPMAYKDYLRKLEDQRKREAEAEAQRESSSYVGEIGSGWILL